MQIFSQPARTPARNGRRPNRARLQSRGTLLSPSFRLHADACTGLAADAPRMFTFWHAWAKVTLHSTKQMPASSELHEFGPHMLQLQHCIAPASSGYHLARSAIATLTLLRATRSLLLAQPGSTSDAQSDCRCIWQSIIMVAACRFKRAVMAFCSACLNFLDSLTPGFLAITNCVPFLSCRRAACQAMIMLHRQCPPQ